MYIGAFSDREDVLGQFHLDESKFEFMKDKEIVFAVYDSYDYDGSAFVLIKGGDKMYEVNGSHCSCYGLEGQFDPEEVTLYELIHRMTKGTLCCGSDEGDYRLQLCEALEKAGVVEKHRIQNALKLFEL